MSARMLSLQIKPSLLRRLTVMVFTEMSIVSARCTIGKTVMPVKLTTGCSLLRLLTMSAVP